MLKVVWNPPPWWVCPWTTFFGRMMPFSRSVLSAHGIPQMKRFLSWHGTGCVLAWITNMPEDDHVFTRNTSEYKVTTVLKAKNDNKALWQIFQVYLLNVEIHAPVFSSAQLALTAASAGPLKSTQSRKYGRWKKITSYGVSFLLGQFLIFNDSDKLTIIYTENPEQLLLGLLIIFFSCLFFFFDQMPENPRWGKTITKLPYLLNQLLSLLTFKSV